MVGASAYAVGREIVFGPGQFAPHTAHGQKLLAHELTHVSQAQRGLHFALEGGESQGGVAGAGLAGAGGSGESGESGGNAGAAGAAGAANGKV